MIANKKPWGHECIAFQNENVAIWHLFIDGHQETSLHCHPNKKTGLVVLDGYAKVSFLSSEQYLDSCEKIMIRQGVFHKTSNIRYLPTQLFEIETPVNKSDLVRIKDKYNRDKSYYTEEVIDINQKYSWDGGSFTIGDCFVGLRKIGSSAQFSLNAIYMIVSHGIFSNDYCICGPGDTISGYTLSMLADEFELRTETEAVVIHK